MKKVLMFIAVATMLVACSKPSKFKIKDADGNVYNTDAYSISGNCVVFDYACGCNDGGKDNKQKVTVCGSYTIKTNE
jgi:hypothetical protein